MVFGLFSRKRRSESPAPAPPPSPSITPPPIPDPSSLHALILSVPPKILQSYTLSHLSTPPSPTTLTAISSFFADLTPPPRLHCLRCHKDYYDVENTDRSCLVPHDDESAEVERVGRSAGVTKGKAGGFLTEYETLWGCCGQSVEGDGDMGPPDGWCYEGKHTTDVKRARFRADSTLHKDKLISCDRLNCHGTRSDTTSPRSRKRARPNLAEGSGDGSGSDVEGSLQTNPMPKPIKSPAKGKGKGKASTPTTSTADAEGDISMDSENLHPTSTAPEKPRTAKPKPISHAPSQSSPLAPTSRVGPPPKSSTSSSTPGSTSPKLKPKSNPNPKPRSRSRPGSTARGRSRPRAKPLSVDSEEGGGDGPGDSDVNGDGNGEGREGRKVNKRRKMT